MSVHPWHDAVSGRDVLVVIYALGVLAALYLGRDMGAEQERARAQQAHSLCSEVRGAQRQMAEQQRATAAAVAAARDEAAETGRACTEVAETCAVPGVWLDVGVLPLGRPGPDVVRR